MNWEDKMKKYLLEMVVFICGAAVMVLELLAARILSPYVGSSNIVWTSIIGIILLSMSLGYFLGGKLADKKPEKEVLSSIILGGTIFIGIIPFLEVIVIKSFSEIIENLTIAAIGTSLFVFAIPSLLLAMVSPYAIKLKEADSENIGRVAGNLSAFSTLGSIFGTFLAGFYLIPSFGNKFIILGLMITLLILAFILSPKKDFEYCSRFFIITVILILVWFFGKSIFFTANPGVIADIDTEYSRAWISRVYDYDGNEYKALLVDRALESYIDKEGKMGAEYLEFYDLFDNYNPNAKSTLLIGGAAYTYPMHYLNKFSDKTIDVVEIDPKMTEIAKKYFDLTENERLKVYHEDGRSFLNKGEKQYDTILIDAFKGQNVPFELTTVEALYKAKDMLSENGMVIANVISAFEGKNAYFLQAEYTTFSQVFPEVKVFQVKSEERMDERQNTIIIGFKSKETAKSFNEEYQKYIKREIKEVTLEGTILTDDYAPVEKYI